MSCLSEIETDVDDISKTHISAEAELHFPIYLTKETVNEIQVNSDLDQKPTDDIRLLLEIYKDFSADTPGLRELRTFMYLNTAKLAKLGFGDGLWLYSCTSTNWKDTKALIR